MIKLTKEIIDKTTFLEFVDIEKNHIRSSIVAQENLNKKLVFHLKFFVNSISHNSLPNENNNKLDCLENTTKFLKLSNCNIYSLTNLINSLEKISNDHSLENEEELKKSEEKLEEYNNLYINTYSDVSINNNSINFFINKNCIDEIEEIKIENKEIENIDKTIEFKQILNIDYPEKTLLISEIDNKVLLPYNNDEIISILKNPNFTFKSEQEVIDRHYTIPNSNYKASSISRFREAYKLIREKEKGSISKALELGIELFSNYNLHPAIITACKNLNELDIYLSCLEYNELEDFNYFKTEFKIAPSNIKIKT